MFIHRNRSNKTNNRHLEIATNQSAGRSDFLHTLHYWFWFSTSDSIKSYFTIEVENQTQMTTSVEQRKTYSSKVLLLVSVIRG